jgi:hypothetical protein
MIEKRIKQIKTQRRIIMSSERTKHRYLWVELEELDIRVIVNKKNFWRNVDGYAKCSCRILCQQIQDTLPLELRQMIYSYLNDVRTVAVNDWPSFRDKRSLVQPIPYFTSYPASPYDGLATAHYWNHEYVGEEVVQELAKDFYANTYFDFRDNLHLIPRTLKEDRWGLGIIPGSRICHVKMDLFGRTGIQIPRTADTKSVDNLLMFKPSTRFIINVNNSYKAFLGAEENSTSYIRHFEMRFPFVRRLENAGYRLTLRPDMSNYKSWDVPVISREMVADSIKGLVDLQLKGSLTGLPISAHLTQLLTNLTFRLNKRMLLNCRMNLSTGGLKDQTMYLLMKSRSEYNCLLRISRRS